MKRRLRKKLMLGEFQEFLVNVEIQTYAAQVDQDLFLDRWIDEVETNDMMCGGGGGKDGKWSFVVGCHAELEKSRAKRANLERWLAAEPGVREFSISPVTADLTRAFHGSPQAAMHQQRLNRQRGVDSEIWRD